jgi:hypothetical protein
MHMKSLKPAAVFSVMILAAVGATIGVIGIGGSLVLREAEAVGPAVEIFISDDSTFARVEVGGDRNGLTVEADANSLSAEVEAAGYDVWRANFGRSQ